MFFGLSCATFFMTAPRGRALFGPLEDPEPAPQRMDEPRDPCASIRSRASIRGQAGPLLRCCMHGKRRPGIAGASVRCVLYRTDSAATSL